MPQLSAVFGVSETSGLYVIADGGLWTGGDLSKVIGAGAKLGMLGSRLGMAMESPGKRNDDGKKIIRGQASASYMKDNSVDLGEFREAEGIEAKVVTRETLAQIVNGLMGGLRSSMSYLGASSLQELYEISRFIYVDAAAQQGAKPHLLSKT